MTTLPRVRRSAGPLRRLRGTFGALLLFSGLALAGCGGGAEAAGDPESGGTLRLALLGSPESLDPHLNTTFAASNYGNSVFDKLTWQNPDTGDVEPWLATEWVTNDDFTRFTFTLRDDVTFSDGTGFDATSVKNNLDQYVFGDESLDIKPNGATHLHGYTESIVESEHEVTVVFDQPSAGFLQFVSYSGNNQFGILGEATLESNAEERLDPANIVGTGPFTVSEYTPDEKVVLHRRDDYDWGPAGLDHQGPAYLEAVELITIPEASVRTGALQSGDVQAAFDILPTDEPVLEASGFDITSRTIPGVNLGWNLNTSVAPTDDVDVRRAIIRATNRALFKETLLADTEEEATSALASSVQGYADFSDTALRYDLDEARTLLDDAGWIVGEDGIREKDGERLELKATSHILVPNSRVVYEAIQAELRDIGVEVEILFDSRNVPVEQLRAEYHLLNTNRSRNDPSMLNVNFNPERTNGAVIGEDFEGRAELIEALDLIETTLDPDLRANYTRTGQELVLDEYALFNPVFEPSQVAASTGVNDLHLDATARLYFLTTWLSPS